MDALDVTRELLEGFGFEVIEHDYQKYEYDILYKGKKICELGEYRNCCQIETPWDSYEYFHEFIEGMHNKFPEILNLEWKGVEE